MTNATAALSELTEKEADIDVLRRRTQRARSAHRADTVLSQPLRNRRVRCAQPLGELAGGRVLGHSCSSSAARSRRPLRRAWRPPRRPPRPAPCRTGGGVGQLEVGHVDHRRVAHRGRAEDHVLQLPHVAGPGVGQQRRARRRAQARRRAPGLRAGPFEEDLRPAAGCPRCARAAAACCSCSTSSRKSRSWRKVPAADHLPPGRGGSR